MSENTHPSGIGVDPDEPIAIDAEAPLDEVYGALSNERRRRVLSELTHEDVPIDVKALARRISVQEASETAESVTEKSIRKVSISLYHQHLPKLADVDLITYDPDERLVEGIADPIDPIRA